jgi:hypothetical protein
MGKPLLQPAKAADQAPDWGPPRTDLLSQGSQTPIAPQA